MAKRFLILFSVFLAALGCAEPQPVDDDDATEEPTPEPPLPFLADCDEELNDEPGDWSGIEPEDGWRMDDVELCAGDKDYYRVEIPGERWLSVSIEIDGTGTGFTYTDFDLYELEEDPGEDDDFVWMSATEEPYERLAWFNPGPDPMYRYLLVDAYSGSHGNYDIVVQKSRFHDEQDCDDAYPDEEEDDEDGPCNRIMQVPQANTEEDGYLVTHEARYSNLRRELIYLVHHATEDVRLRWDDEAPLALMDMSEWDGDTPGTDDNQLRHPEGTHVEGNDIDIAYYQNGDDNLGRAVCPNDGYFCTSAPDDLDPRRTAYFVAKLFEGDNVRVIGMDTRIAAEVQDAADELHDDGEIEDEIWELFYDQIAYGDGWPFHHHHMHFSWNWESGHERRLPTPDGCMTVAESGRVEARAASN